MKTIDDSIESTGAAGSVAPAAATAPGAEGGAGERLEKAKRNKRRAAKLRAVWISFTGRIVAQFVGSAASILLGMMMIHNYKASPPVAEQAALAQIPAAYEGRAARTDDASGPRRRSIVVLPIDDYSRAVPEDRFAASLTDQVTASLAERGSLVVLSRTSASQVGSRRENVPAVARELAVDFVLESSVTRSGNRLRVVAQLIDGRSDEHLWVGRFDREAADVLGLQGEIADQIARGIDAAANGRASRVSATAMRSASAAVVAPLDPRAGVALQTLPLARGQQQP
jgi:TolB-like protein